MFAGALRAPGADGDGALAARAQNGEVLEWALRADPGAVPAAVARDSVAPCLAQLTGIARVC